MNDVSIGTALSVAWKDKDWAELLARIRGRKVIPVIGEELLQVEIEGKPVSLYTWVANRLARSLDVPASELLSPGSLNDVACRYLEERDSDPNSIYTSLSIIMEEAMPNLRPPVALRQLAEITDFDLFLTTAFDPLMELALNEVRKKEAQSLVYSPRLRQEDLAAPRDISRPTVYHLFGMLDVAPTYVVTKEDLLEWLHAMESQPRPRNLFDELRQKYLLILGAPFVDWLPWFLRLRVDQPLSIPSRHFEYLADNRIAESPDLVFLRHFSKQTKRYEGDAMKFVGDLWTRWTESRPLRREPEPVPLAPEPPKGAIFISYAEPEDLDAAKKLKAGLELAGLDVWFDKDQLHGGDAWPQKIMGNIKRCSFFLPLISQNSVGKQDRYFIVEWNCALERAKRFLAGQAFILPIVIDHTDIRTAEVPEAFKSEIMAVYLRGGEVTPDFTAHMQTLRASRP